MPLQLRSELRLRVGPQHSEGGLWRAGLSANCVLKAQASGAVVTAVPQVLAELLAADRRPPRRASVWVADEFLYKAKKNGRNRTEGQGP